MTNDEKILDRWKTLVHFLGDALGENYEVVLHDVRPKSPGVIAIENGNISGRKLGAPITDKMLHVIETKAYKKTPYMTNYTGAVKTNAFTRSSTMFIKNANDELIGLLCINFDDSKIKNALRQVVRLVHPANFDITDTGGNFQNGNGANILSASGEGKRNKNAGTAFAGANAAALNAGAGNAGIENFHANVDKLIEDMFEKVSLSCTVPLERLRQNERMKLIAQLQDFGFFRIKGSAEYAGKRLHCSTASIYRYLAKLH